jgi:outer membrane biosynthesis protein TonB
MAAKLPSNNAFEEFLQTPKADKHFRLSVSRNTLVAFIVSLLTHALILFFVMPKFKQTPEVEPPPFEVVLAQPEQVETPPAPLPETLPQEPIPEPPAAPVKKPKVMTKPKSKTPKPSDFSVPDVLTTPQPAPDKAPSPDDKPVDMMAYVDKKRAERAEEEANAARINAVAIAKERGPSEDEKRDAKIKSNFQNGTNGIFEITSLSSNSATFTFLGWVGDFSASHRQYFNVEASRGEDVRRVMIRRMISLIREHYQGDFNWESHRLARTIVLSARPEDSAGLEDFLMLEFFGQNYKTAL